MNMNTSKEISNALIDQVKIRLFEECVPRIIKCLGLLTTDQIWWRPNEASNSVGNIILHLNGNVHQWILNGLDGQPDIRNRKKEFTNREKLDDLQLKHILANLEKVVLAALDRIDPESLLKLRPVQIYKETGVAILVHVTEHFSYHTGQIAYITKMIKNRPLSFYDEHQLDQ